MKWFLTRRWLSYVAAPLLLQWNVAPARAQSTATPIKHVIVIIGENRSFDHVFATYRPHGGQSVSNLLSKDIINADGKPSHNFGLSAQNQATDLSTFQLSPGSKSPFTVLPAPNTDGPAIGERHQPSSVCNTGRGYRGRTGPAALRSAIAADRRNRTAGRLDRHAD